MQWSKQLLALRIAGVIYPFVFPGGRITACRIFRRATALGVTRSLNHSTHLRHLARIKHQARVHPTSINDILCAYPPPRNGPRPLTRHIVVTTRHHEMDNLSLNDAPPPALGPGGPRGPPQQQPQLPPQMFTTAAQLLDMTDSRSSLLDCPGCFTR